MIFSILFLLKIVLNSWDPLWLHVNFRRFIYSFRSSMAWCQQHGSSGMGPLDSGVMKMYVQTVTTSLHPAWGLEGARLSTKSFTQGLLWSIWSLYKHLLWKALQFILVILRKKPGKLLTKKFLFLTLRYKNICLYHCFCLFSATLKGYLCVLYKFKLC